LPSELLTLVSRLLASELPFYEKHTLPHPSKVLFAASNSAGDKIVTASEDKTAKVWDCDGDLVLTLDGHEKAVKSALFNSDDNLIITSSFDGTTRIWTCDDIQLALLHMKVICHDRDISQDWILLSVR